MLTNYQVYLNKYEKTYTVNIKKYNLNYIHEILYIEYYILS